MKDEGTVSKAPLKESIGKWKNLKLVLIALFGLTAGQAVVWYTGQFYALYFLTQTLRVEANIANIMVARSEEHTSELQSLLRNSYAVFCLTIKTNEYIHYSLKIPNILT